MKGPRKYIKIKTRRRNMWEKDPHCAWCGVTTVLINVNYSRNVFLPHEATVDHLNHGTNKTVLACYKCNQTRGFLEQAIRRIDRALEAS